MYVQTYGGNLRIEYHESDLFCTISSLWNPGNTITAPAFDLITLLGDIKRDNGVSLGPFQINHDIDGSAYVITHLCRPSSVVLTRSEYREVRDALRERELSD